MSKCDADNGVPVGGSELSETENRVYDILRGCKLDAGRRLGAVPFKGSEKKWENIADSWPTFSIRGVTAVEACVEMRRSV